MIFQCHWPGCLPIWFGLQFTRTVRGGAVLRAMFADFTRSSFVAYVLPSSSGAAAVMFAGLLVDVKKARTACRAPSGSWGFRRGLSQAISCERKKTRHLPGPSRLWRRGVCALKPIGGVRGRPPPHGHSVDAERRPVEHLHATPERRLSRPPAGIWKNPALPLVSVLYGRCPLGGGPFRLATGSLLHRSLVRDSGGKRIRLCKGCP